MCEQCIISIPRTYHIECVMPELRKVFEKGQTSDVKRLDEQIARTAEKVREDERKLEEAKQELDRMKQKLDELKKQRAELTSGKEKNCAAVTEEANSEGSVRFSV
ncbi:hypothetical protein MLD38_020981 [Melastoma candidum]|uniref:Uncharacterized protein n=1 Tax=Melastoma candidum TaxID=119954 RepID=A0ACB9QEY2_9MYRT|nr:hypothetical protein MLD38_020981 [Melastoma candidum]